MACSVEENTNLELIGRGQEGIVQTGQTQYLGYACPKSRQNSYRNWMYDHIVPRDYLVKNGFFYTGVLDHVRCFHCGVELYNWDIGDDPYTEHCNRFPECSFIMLCQTSRQRTDQLAYQSPNARAEIVEEVEDDVTADFMSQNQNSKLPSPNGGNAIPQESPDTIAEENDRLRGLQICRLCRETDANVVFMPCGHLISCHVCSYTHKQCFICTNEIQGRIRVFRA